MNELMEYGARMWCLGLSGLLGIVALELLLAAFVKRLVFRNAQQSLQSCQ